MSIEEKNKLKEELNTLQTKSEKLQNKYKELEGYVFFLKTKKLSRGLTEHENTIYEKQKRELLIVASELKNTKEREKTLALIA